MKREGLTLIHSPSRNDRALWVERLKGEDQQSFVIASKKLYGFYSHWTGKRSVPCWENHALCEGGHSDENLRENFLLQAWSLKKNRMVFLYLTPEAARQLEDQIQPGTPYLGLPVIVTRTKANNGRLHIRVSEFTTSQKLSTREVDPFESVMNFLRVPKAVRDQGRALGTGPGTLKNGEIEDERLKALVSVSSFKQRNGCLSGERLRTQD